MSLVFKELTAAQIAMCNKIWSREYLCDVTVDEWLSRKNISEADALAYPNARTAYELQQSPLGKALV